MITIGSAILPKDIPDVRSADISLSLLNLPIAMATPKSVATGNVNIKMEGSLNKSSCSTAGSGMPLLMIKSTKVKRRSTVITMTKPTIPKKNGERTSFVK